MIVIRAAMLMFAMQVAAANASAVSFERATLKRASGVACPSTRAVEDSEPHVAVLDEHRGKYAMRWVGEYGARKEIVFYCPDRVDVIVTAVVSRRAGKFRYEYNIVSRDSSGQPVRGIVLQTFASSVRVLEPKPAEDRYIGEMNGAVMPEFASGTWYRIPFSAAELPPGGSRRIVVESEAPPGLVGLRAHGGPLEMQGAGEESPPQLDAQVPKARVWPRGLTIGPVADTRDPDYPFNGLTLTEILSDIHEAGWLSKETFDRYLGLAKKSAGNELAASVERDVAAGRAAPELRHVLRLFEQATTESR